MIKDGITALHYHADNGRFTDKNFLKDIVECKQTIFFCGAYAYFQNRKIEKHIHGYKMMAKPFYCILLQGGQTHHQFTIRVMIYTM